MILSTFTYYTDSLIDSFESFVSSLVINLEKTESSELFIFTNSKIPIKTREFCWKLFGRVQILQIPSQVISLRDGLPEYVIKEYSGLNRIYADPNLIITGPLDFNQYSRSAFYRGSDTLFTTKLFYLTSDSKLGQVISQTAKLEMVHRPRPRLTNQSLSFILSNNFLFSNIVVSNKLILSKSDLDDSIFNGEQLDNAIALDLFECLGKNYKSLNSQLSQIRKTYSSGLSKLKKQKSQTQLRGSIIGDGSIENTRDASRVSVIMTNYNCDELIEKAILSVLKQTHTNLELLIVDDASTDQSLFKIINLANSDPRIRVFKNLERRGTYWSKNSVLHFTTGSYITMIDSDDYDVPTKLEKQLLKFKENPQAVCVTCLADRKVAVHSDVSEKISLGYPSMMFKYLVFSELGHYDTVKFGADSEFFDRIKLKYGKQAVSHVSEVLQICPRRTLGLTGQVPEGSSPRLNYLNAYRAWQSTSPQKYLKFPTKDRPFSIAPESLVEYTDLSNSAVVVTASTRIVPIIMCVWKRLEGFKQTIIQLNSQTFKGFKLFVWCNNPELSSNFENLLQTTAKFEYEFYCSPKNVGGFGRFYYAANIRRTQGLIDNCIFIDDDQTFGSELIETLISEFAVNTITSQWGWQFNSLEYYGSENRILRSPGESLHYAGTGGMTVDMRIFSSDGLFECPEKYWFVEDLWLSFYANHNFGYSLLKSSAKMINGDDEHSLYKRVKDVKSEMLADLINNFGWQILSTDKFESTGELIELPEESMPAQIQPDSPKSENSPKRINFLLKLIKGLG